eukprot:1133570_1
MTEYQHTLLRGTTISCALHLISAPTLNLHPCESDYVGMKHSKNRIYTTAKHYIYAQMKTTFVLKFNALTFTIDKNPIYLTVSKHATINELKRAFLSYFQCDINAKQKMSKYKHKFNDLESKLAGDYYINNDFTIELSTESIQLYTSYMKIKPEEMISSKQQSLLKHIWKRELHTYNATGTDRVFVIPSFEIQLIVTDEKDKSHFVISVNSDCSSLALYQSIAGKLNVDIRTLVLKRDSDEYIECNLIKSIESYSLSPE